MNKIFSFHQLFHFHGLVWPKPNEFQRNIKSVLEDADLEMIMYHMLLKALEQTPLGIKGSGLDVHFILIKNKNKSSPLSGEDPSLSDGFACQTRTFEALQRL